MKRMAHAPAAGSPEQARDLAAVLEAQAARTPAQVEAARLDQDVSIGRFADVLGPGFTAECLPRTFALAGKACRESSMVIAAARTPRCAVRAGHRLRAEPHRGRRALPDGRRRRPDGGGGHRRRAVREPRLPR